MDPRRYGEKKVGKRGQAKAAAGPDLLRQAKLSDRDLQRYSGLTDYFQTPN